LKLDRLGVMSPLTGRQANGRVGGWFHRHHIAPDLAPPDRTRSNVCHAAALISISAWAGVL
jgi:hypothetical protein